ncbi:MAG: ATP-binding cassette domain-containing protein [bacterium]
MLLIENLSKKFDHLKVLDGVSLQIKPGQIVGLLGANGAGKSTLIDVVCGPIKMDSGLVKLNGTDLTKLSIASKVKLGLSRTFQYNGLFKEMTVFENFLLSKYAKLNTFQTLVLDFGRILPLNRNKEIAELADLLNNFQLEVEINKKVGKLSGGQSKILELAMVYLRQPKYILMDEPLAGVSKKLKTRVLVILKQMADSGIGILLIEHDTEFVISLSDKVWELDGGRLFRG